MLREYIEDELGIRVELQRLDAPCGVCRCVTPHTNCKHRQDYKRGKSDFACMCLNHCDPELDEVIAEVSFRHVPTGNYVHAPDLFFG